MGFNIAFFNCIRTIFPEHMEELWPSLVNAFGKIGRTQLTLNAHFRLAGLSAAAARLPGRSTENCGPSPKA